MTEQFKFEYDDNEESQYVRKLYGEKYLRETDEEKRAKLKMDIMRVYRLIDMDKSQHERYKQIQAKQYTLSEHDRTEAKHIIRENFRSNKRWMEQCGEHPGNEEFWNRQLGIVMWNLNRPRFGYNGKTHVGPLHLYSHESINKLRMIFGKKQPEFSFNA
jgi:hypothetical protein